MLLLPALGFPPADARERRPLPRSQSPASMGKLPRQVPFPPPRPSSVARQAVAPPAMPSAPAPEATAPASAEPSACRQRLTSDLATMQSLPPISGTGGCGVDDPVRLEAVLTRAGRRVVLAPAAVVRCEMAEAIVHWVRDDVVTSFGAAEAPLATLTTAAAYECRGRNRIVGARLSQHGVGNALDVRGFKLADGKAVELTDPHVSKDLRLRLQASACARFTTVLGPGSDGYHEDHVHLDILERRSGYRLCQWDVRDPAEAAAAVAAAAARARPKFVPLRHEDGSAMGAIVPPPAARVRASAERSESCPAGRECPPTASRRPARVHRRGAARPLGGLPAVFRW